MRAYLAPISLQQAKAKRWAPKIFRETQTHKQRKTSGWDYGWQRGIVWWGKVVEIQAILESFTHLSVSLSVCLRKQSKIILLPPNSIHFS